MANKSHQQPQSLPTNNGGKTRKTTPATQKPATSRQRRRTATATKPAQRKRKILAFTKKKPKEAYYLLIGFVIGAILVLLGWMARMALMPMPAAPQPQTGAVCRADKIATWSEVNSAGPQRMEITVADGVLHLDYYPNKGVPSVSIIVHDNESAVLMGFGSAWFFPNRDCATYDNIADATSYAKGRHQWNHSGLVYASLNDYLIGNAPVVNLYNVDYTQFQPVLASTTTAIVTGAQPGCPPATETTYNVPTVFTVQGPAIVHPWWNNGKPSFGQSQVRVKLKAGETATFLGAMGKTYMYVNNPACNNNLDTEFANSNLPIKTIAELKSEGLVR